MKTSLLERSIFALSILLGTSVGYAAVSKNHIQSVSALRLPLTQRLAAVEKQGAAGRQELARMAFDEKESLENRWRAVTAMGRVYPKESQKQLEKALKSPEWFMRNAALVVVPYNNRDWAVRWSRVLMHDPALVVRTAAVKALRQMHAVETQDLLWEKLYSSENYKNGQSLWIREHILEALSQFALPGSEAQFIRVLQDRDASLHPVARATLKKLTNRSFETSDQWVSWWETKSVKR